ncbi:MAG: hypothetical protein ACQETO_10780, partial [Pseudomonadota bacterium]
HVYLLNMAHNENDSSVQCFTGIIQPVATTPPLQRSDTDDTCGDTLLPKTDNSMEITVIDSPCPNPDRGLDLSARG